MVLIEDFYACVMRLLAGAIMETQHVKYFLAACDELNFTRAAQKCGIKQPTLSEAIKQMEQAIGGELFVRGSPVRLTALGFQLRPICVQINELLENVRAMSTSLGANSLAVEWRTSVRVRIEPQSF
jgi:DNA-binding transcriptional LysR family regulator